VSGFTRTLAARKVSQGNSKPAVFEIPKRTAFAFMVALQENSQSESYRSDEERQKPLRIVQIRTSEQPKRKLNIVFAYRCFWTCYKNEDDCGEHSTDYKFNFNLSRFLQLATNFFG
jgi:hypothetical protein